MKTSIIAFTGAIAISTISFAQIVSIDIGGSGDISGTLYDVTASSAEIHLVARVTNLISDSMDLQITRDRIISYPSWEDHFCWGVLGDPFGSCYDFYPEDPWTSPVSDTVRLQQDDTGKLDIYIKPLDPDFGCAIYRYIVRQGATLIDSVDIGVCKTADIETPINGLELNIYPNPANTSITVNFDGPPNSSIVLLDIFGRIVVSERASSVTNMIDLRNFTAGIYFVLVRTPNGDIYREKVLIERS